MEKKLCVDCKYHSFEGKEVEKYCFFKDIVYKTGKIGKPIHICNYFTDPVDGSSIKHPCKLMRDRGDCGPRGEYFQPKDPNKQW